jgi:hypothetical protein
VAVGGVNPAKVLPIQLDFGEIRFYYIIIIIILLLLLLGTNNKTLLDDPLYIGRKTPRVPHELFIEVLLLL